MKEDIYYGCIYGVSEDDTYFDDFEEFSNRELLNYKIIKQRIYLGYLEGKKVILGIGTTFKNLWNGNTVNKDHKKDLQVLEEIEELIIKDDDYLTNVFIQMNQYDALISFIRFITHNNNQISSGEYEENNLDNILNQKNDVIVGFYGGINKRLKYIGCIYTRKDIYYKNLFFGIFILKYFAKKDKNFRDKWNEGLKELDVSSKYLWKAVNLPDNCNYSYYLIIKYLSPF